MKRGETDSSKPELCIFARFTSVPGNQGFSPPIELSFSSVQFSPSVGSNSLWPQELQHARPPCPLPTPGVHSSSRPSSQWCHPAISPSVVPFSSCPQSLPASESFSMSQFFAWGGSHSLYQGIFRTKRLNTCLLHCRQILYWVTKEDVRGIHTHTNTHTQTHTHIYIYTCTYI